MEIEQRLQIARRTPALEAVSAAAERAGVAAYLVGGAVRDAVAGLRVGDLDVAVEGELDPLLHELGGTARRHPRFGTATVRVEGVAVDLARTRSEIYSAPGALPQVQPADLSADLSRRDFTVNAMAVPLRGPASLIDPSGGRGDLERGLLRVLHRRSFEDDPTRAYRAARYAARLGLVLAPDTEELLRDADPDTVSADRRRAEIERIAAEPTAVEALALLGRWGVEVIDDAALDLAAEVERLSGSPPWAGLGLRQSALVLLVLEGTLPEPALAAAALRPASPSEGIDAARGLERRPELLLLARAGGGEWLDQWLSEWRGMRLRIGGADLLARGVRRGPAVGRALREVLRMRLDGEIDDDEEAQLEAALRIAAAPPAPGGDLGSSPG